MQRVARLSAFIKPGAEWHNAVNQIRLPKYATTHSASARPHEGPATHQVTVSHGWVGPTLSGTFIRASTFSKICKAAANLGDAEKSDPSERCRGDQREHRMSIP